MSRRPPDTGSGSASGTRLLYTLALMCTLLAPAHAQQAPGELGRLFFTPERRQTLDRQRQLNIQEKVPDDPTLTINGVVTRSSGKRTVWINGAAQNENDGGVAVTPRHKDPGRVVVEATNAPAANARVGDTVNRTTGETTDLLGGGRISTRPGVAK
jgi:hypothetical protein